MAPAYSLIFVVFLCTVPFSSCEGNWGPDYGTPGLPTPLIEGPSPESDSPPQSGGFGDDKWVPMMNETLPATDGNTTEAPAQPQPRIVFSEPPVDQGYTAKASFSARGMDHLYLLTETFLRVMRRHKEIPPELGSLVSRELELGTSLNKKEALRVARDLGSNWNVLVVHYLGLVLLAVLGLLLGALMPIVGLVFLCCRCGGKCGASREPSYDKKRDPCKRVILGALLIIFVVAVLFGLVCSFVTNARVDAGTRDLPSELEVSVHDAKLFLNNTHKEVKTLCETNFKELQKILFNKLDSSGKLINVELARVSKAIAIENLTLIASSLTRIKDDLRIIRNTTIQLQGETSYLQSGLRDVANRLRKLKATCEAIPECLALISNYSARLEINNAFNKLPSVKGKLEEVTRLIDNDIEIEVKRGKRDFDSIAREIQSKVQTSIPEIKQQIKVTGHEMRKISRELGRRVKNVDFDKASRYIDVSREYIEEYAMYRYWAFFLVCCLLLLITLCFTMGVMFGCCGRRPDETSSCYKTTGASWLMWSVGFTFLFGAVIMVATSSLFVVGSLGDILVCDPLQDPSDSEVFAIAAQKVNLGRVLSTKNPPLLTDVIRKCHLNQSMYSVLELHSYDALIENLSNYRDFLRLEEKIDQIKSEIGGSIDTNVQILSKEAKQQLKNLAKSSLANKEEWDYYTDILEQEVLTVDLLDLAAQMNHTADQLPPDYISISFKLKNDAIYLDGLRRWLSSIKTSSRTLKDATKRLRDELRFNKTSLGVALRDLMKEAEYAERYLRLNGSVEVVELVSRFTDDFLADVDHYVDYVKLHLVEEVGRCGPISAVYNASTTALCKGVLLPLNGYWASVGWCFLLFLPCMAIAVKLATLYRKTEPYSGHLSESACDKKSRNRTSRDCGRNYPPEQFSAPPHSPPRGDYHPPNSDWGGGDYPPSGGPPRYTSQPNLSPEYERPPPYYYPGPGDL